MGRMPNIRVKRCFVFELHDAAECVAFPARRNICADVGLKKSGDESLESRNFFRGSVLLSFRRSFFLARQTCPSLRTKRVTPHVLRHTMAMQMLQAGVDRAIIALWLGHESVETTQIYLDANLTLKEEILARTISPEGKLVRFKPDDELMTFLNHL